MRSLKKITNILFFVSVIAFAQLPNSGPLSINDIRNEIGVTTGSLRALGDLAGFPAGSIAISDFYGYQHLVVYAQALGKTDTSKANACGLVAGTTNYYFNNADWKQATVLYSNSEGDAFNTTAHLSDGTYYRYWNGSSFTVSENCDVVATVSLMHNATCSFTDNATNYKLNNANLTNATKLYLADGSTLAPSGNYRDYTNDRWRNWNGTSFTNSIQNCSSLSSDTLGYGGSESAACDDFPNPTTFYTDNANFTQATTIALNASGSTPALAGFYSDGVNVREWNGSAFVGSTQTCN